MTVFKKEAQYFTWGKPVFYIKCVLMNLAEGWYNAASVAFYVQFGLHVVKIQWSQHHLILWEPYHVLQSQCQVTSPCRKQRFYFAVMNHWKSKLIPQERQFTKPSATPCFSVYHFTWLCIWQRFIATHCCMAVIMQRRSRRYHTYGQTSLLSHSVRNPSSKAQLQISKPELCNSTAQNCSVTLII